VPLRSGKTPPAGARCEEAIVRGNVRGIRARNGVISEAACEAARTVYDSGAQWLQAAACFDLICSGDDR